MPNIIQFLEEHGIDYRECGDHHHVSSDEWVNIDCPYCSPRSLRFRMGYNKEKGFVTCWTCGRHPLVESLAEATGLPFGRIRESLKGVTREWVRTEEVRGKLVLPMGIKPLGRLHRQYLKKRGFDPDEIASVWGVQGIGLAVKLSWRLFIPIHHKGEVVSWTTRAIGEEVRARYVNADKHEEKIPASDLLYGEDHATHCIVVVEGPIDAWAIGKGAVAIMGLKKESYKRKQVARIASYPVRYICFDNEEMAQRRARRLAKEVSVFPGKTSVLRLEQGKDAASTTKRELREIRSLLV